MPNTKAVSIAELRKNPVAVFASFPGQPVAVRDDHQVVAYVVPAADFEAMAERLQALERSASASGRAEPILISVEAL